MKILVIDDNQENIKAAKEQFNNPDFDLTVADNYDEAFELICQKKKNTNKPMGYEIIDHDFQIVLCDLMMPASKNKMGEKGMQFIGQEMPVGIFLAIQAGIYGPDNVIVGMLSNTSHHDHPGAAASNDFPLSSFSLGKGNAVFTNRIWYFENENHSKNWIKFLEHIKKQLRK